MTYRIWIDTWIEDYHGRIMHYPRVEKKVKADLKSLGIKATVNIDWNHGVIDLEFANQEDINLFILAYNLERRRIPAVLNDDNNPAPRYYIYSPGE